MRIELGISKKEMKTFEDVCNHINFMYDSDDFSEEMTEQACERYEGWIGMCDVVNKIEYVMKNQRKIEKATNAAKKKNAKRMSKVLIRKADKAIQNLPATPQVHTYVKMYQVLEELHFQGEYKLASEICNVLLKNLGTID